jgi:glycosyltransferase involved in cell wall biosynthesis
MAAHEFAGRRGWFYGLVGRIEKWIDHLPDVAVASCSDVAEELQDRFGVSDVVLALDGVDTDVFRPGLEVGDLQGLVPPDRPTVVYLGLLNAYQGVDHLLKAVPLVLAREPEVHFLVMGYPNEERYRQQAQELGVADHVSLPGRIDYDQAPRYLALGDVAVGPKLSETESNGKLFNYMACSLPTVAFETPPSREILGDLGVYAPRGDVTALSDAIADLLEDPDHARALGVQLRQRVMEHFSWRRTARNLLEAYDLAVAGAGRGAG